jgi:hypothetical protein
VEAVSKRAKGPPPKKTTQAAGRPPPRPHSSMRYPSLSASSSPSSSPPPVLHSPPKPVDVGQAEQMQELFRMIKKVYDHLKRVPRVDEIKELIENTVSERLMSLQSDERTKDSLQGTLSILFCYFSLS